MREELLTYYERELTFLRHMGAEFAQKYPKIASRLQLEADRCEDPHVERLLEAFAFLAARVHLKIDDDFPEITSALLGTLYPHYLRPIPSMSIVEFDLDPEQGKLSTGFAIPRGSTLTSRAVHGSPCRFRTCYDLTLWPLQMEAAQWCTLDRLQPPVRVPEAVGAIRLVLKCLPDVDFSKLDLRTLRFYLNGESNLVHTMYELLADRCVQIMLRVPGAKTSAKTVVLPASSLQPAGFSESEALLPYTRRSFAGYRLLQEYFSFPEKFFFFDLNGLETLRSGDFGNSAEILLFISRFERQERAAGLEVGVTANAIRLGCTPIVNLYSQTAEPILFDQRRYEYPIVPDIRRESAMEIFSVDEVVATRTQSREVTRLEPFYAQKHGDQNSKQVFWYAVRRPAGVKNSQRTEMHLSLADVAGRLVQPEADTLTVRCTCSDHSLPARLPFGSEKGDFDLQGVAAIRKVTALRKPTAPLPPPGGKDALWRLISHLSLNYLSLVEEGREALQGLLQLYNFADSPHLIAQIAGITALGSKRHFAPVVTDSGIAAARGTRIEMEFDEEQFVGGGVYLFAAVLEHFFGQYVSLNSFTQLVARTAQRKEVLKEWPPRAGQLMLI